MRINLDLSTNLIKNKFEKRSKIVPVISRKVKYTIVKFKRRYLYNLCARFISGVIKARINRVLSSSSYSWTRMEYSQLSSLSFATFSCSRSNIDLKFFVPIILTDLIFFLMDFVFYKTNCTWLGIVIEPKAWHSRKL